MKVASYNIGPSIDEHTHAQSNDRPKSGDNIHDVMSQSEKRGKVLSRLRGVAITSSYSLT